MTAAAAIYAVSLTTDITLSSKPNTTATNIRPAQASPKTALTIAIDPALKHVLPNGVTVYEDLDTVARIAEMVNAYPSVWNNQSTTVDIPKEQ